MSVSPILEVFEHQLIPCVEQFGISKIALAQPSWRAWQNAQDHAPDQIRATPTPLLSKRKAVKGKRSHGNFSLNDACWPEDHLHSFRAPNLAFILSGYVVFPLAGYQLHCQPGHAVLVPAGVAQSDGTHLCLDDSVQGNTACKILNMCPHNGVMTCWLSHTRDRSHWSYRSSEETCCISSRQAVFCLEALSEEMVMRKVRHQKVCDGLLNAFVNVMCRELQQSKHLIPLSFSPQSASLPEQDSIVVAQEYIHSHLSEQLSLDKVARSVYMSRRLFTNQFRDKTGQSFQNYLNDCRFKEACNLLKKTDWSIGMIGGFVGLKPTRLREIFNQRIGISPTEFRGRKELPDTAD